MTRLPDFFIIGAAKSGTTTLYNYLSQHKNIYLCTPKEPEYFARTEIYNNGLEYYQGLFTKAKNSQICGEASSIYSLWPHFPDAARRIATHVPHAKLLYLMRNPIERAYSFYVQFVKNYQNNTGDYNVHRTFEECVFPEVYPNRAGQDYFFAKFDSHYPDKPGIFLDGSNYYLQISVFLRYFERHQIMPIVFEDFVENPAHHIGDICSFLGIKDDLGAARHFVRSNISIDHFKRVDTDLLLGELKRRYPALRGLAKRLPTGLKRALGPAIFGRINRQRFLEPPPMRPETRTRLATFFEPSIRQLESLVSIDLTPLAKASLAGPVYTGENRDPAARRFFLGGPED